MKVDFKQSRNGNRGGGVTDYDKGGLRHVGERERHLRERCRFRCRWRCLRCNDANHESLTILSYMITFVADGVCERPSLTTSGMLHTLC